MWRRYSLSCVNFLPQCSHSLSKFCFTLPFFPWVAFLTCRLNRAFSKNSFPHTLHLAKGQNIQCSSPSTSNYCLSHSRVQISYNREIQLSITGPSKSTSGKKKSTSFSCFSNLTWRALQQCAIWRASTSLSSSCSISHRPGTGRALGLSAYSCAAAGLSLQRNSYHSYNERTKGVKPLCGKIHE